MVHAWYVYASTKLAILMKLDQIGESVDVVSGVRERLPPASEQSLIPLRFREHDKVSGGLPFWLQDLVSRSSRVSS